MRELLARLASRPLRAAELLLASLLANLLALALPLYVIQVLNRYLSYGIDATLITLTVGALGAVALEWAFRSVRLRLAEPLGIQRTREWLRGASGVLFTADAVALERVPRKQREEWFAAREQIESAYAAPQLVALLDVPFAALFVLVLALISPLLGMVTAAFILAVFLYSLWGQYRLRAHLQQVSRTAMHGQEVLQQAQVHIDSIRLFDRSRRLQQRWEQHLDPWLHAKRDLGRQQGQTQTLTATLQAVMGITIYALGAQAVMTGALDIGMLIGANILAFRALGPIVRFAQLGESLLRAGQALQRLRQLERLPRESDRGTARRRFSGRIQFQDVAFAYPGMPQPLFESLTLDLLPRTVLLVTGGNGTGKTTLARLLTGLLTPTRGQILADGIDLRQLAPQWWRGQLQYVPQDTDLLVGSLRENLQAARLEPLPEEELRTILEDSGLTRFVDQREDGLDLPLGEDARLSPGYRRRMALARARAVGGPLVLLDEPTEGLDQEGRRAVYRLCMRLAQQGDLTLVLITDDPVLRHLATLHLDLDSKPVPRWSRVESVNPQSRPEPASAALEAGKRSVSPSPENGALSSPPTLATGSVSGLTT